MVALMALSMIYCKQTIDCRVGVAVQPFAKLSHEVIRRTLNLGTEGFISFMGGCDLPNAGES